MSTVGIVMATYNGSKYIREQINSILNNTYTDWTLWICDDGSKDNTLTILKEYETKYPGKIRVHQNPKNLGLVRNFLEGTKECDTRYIMFCDQDDVWNKDKIQITLNEMKRMEDKEGNHNPITVFTDVTVVNSKLSQLHSSFYQVSKLDTNQLDLPHILMENKLIGCTIMFNLSVKEKMTKLPKLARVHDWWIAILSASFGMISYLPETTLLYRQHENNVIGNQSFYSYVQKRIKTLWKQRQVLLSTQKQAYEFYEIYQNQLSRKNKKIVYEFAMLHKRNWFIRRYIIVKNGYLKTGLLRNIGVLLLI